MNTMTRIDYVDDRNIHHDFPATVENDDRGYIVRVYPNDALLGTPAEFVEIALRETANGSLQVVALHNPTSNWSNHIGVVSNTLLHCSRLFKVVIVSSPPSSNDPTVWRSLDATAMWERLVERKLASYDPVNRQFYIPNETR